MDGCWWHLAWELVGPLGLGEGKAGSPTTKITVPSL